MSNFVYAPGAKWTEGEVRRLIEDDERDAMKEVLSYLCERGPRVVMWGVLDDPEKEAEAERDAEIAAQDAEDEEREARADAAMEARGDAIREGDRSK